MTDIDIQRMKNAVDEIKAEHASALVVFMDADGRVKISSAGTLLTLSYMQQNVQHLLFEMMAARVK